MRHYQILLILATISQYGTLSQSCGFITRQEWGAESPSSVDRLTKPASYIAIHHTYSPPICTTTDQCKKAMRSIQNYHKNQKNWGDIGYSFCIGGDGNIYEGRGWGVEGAHTFGWNRKAIGVCFIGDYTRTLPEPNMLECINELSNIGVKEGKLIKDFEYFAHRQVVTTTECPGDAFYEYIKKMPRWTPKPT